MNKRLFLIMMCLLLLIPLNAYAAASASITGTDIAVSDSYQTVPIYLTDNPGIMGYKISLEYPEEIEIKSIGRGTICSGGMFETNLENHKGNTIDVVWSSTENITDDGSVLVINLKAPLSAVGKEIKITYSKEDTFNEEWEDVALFCTGLSIISKENQITENNISNETITDKDYDYIKSVIETELENYNTDSIEELNDSDKDKFVVSVSKLLNGIEINEADDVKSLYNASIKNEFVSSVKVTVDSETIKEIIKESLEICGVRSINELDNKSYKSFNENVVKRIKKVYPEYDSAFDKLGEKDKSDAIKELYINTKEKKDNHDKRINIIKYIIISASSVIILSLIILLIVKNKKKAGSINEKNTINNSCTSDSNN